MKTIQVGSMISDGGRSGRVEAPDGNFAVNFRENGQGEITPEHLFAGAYAACFHGAVQNAAERAHIEIPGLAVVANVSLEENHRGEYQLAVELRASMPGVNRKDGEHLLHQAHNTCPYSKALRGNVTVDLVFD